MTTEVFWTLPPSGDGRKTNPAGWTRRDEAGARPAFPRLLTDATAGRYNYYDYLFQVARASESAGFDGAFLPWEPAGEDPWIVAASFARHTRRLIFVPEIEPGFATPVYLAKMSASFQRLSGNRLHWKLDVDRDPATRRAHGDVLSGDDWLQRADEYITAAKGVWSTHPYDYRGRFYEVEAGGLQDALRGLPLPRLFTSGASDTALALAAKHADVHLFDAAGEGSPAAFRSLAARAEKEGRTVRAGLRIPLVARHTETEAVEAARQLGADARRHWIGAFDVIAARLEDWARRGVDVFVLSSPPHLEEAYRLGEHLLPRLASRFAPAAHAG